ncbi:MAG: VacJ family lipoprotein [Burkholderiaceae bacterium]|nr:VacJ family lipoprotein [Burkholderiaceae bacterium]
MGARLIAATLLVLAAAGCASIPPDAGRNPADPLEVYNRHVFEFNERLDRYVVKPIAEGYVKAVPEPVRDCIGNVFRNLGDVGNAVNNLLQGKFFEASADLCRVAINSTVGLFGCFDVASRMGLARSNEDFGQTLGRWGIGPGPYFVLPLLGPSTIRDAFGRVADAYGDPLTYLDSARVAIGAQTLRVIDTRAGLLEASRLLEGAALDRYQFVRDAYLQRRRNLIYDGNPPREREPEEEPAREGGAADRPAAPLGR